MISDHPVSEFDIAAVSEQGDQIHRTIMTMNGHTRKSKRVCFSYAAYAKNIIDHLKSSNVPVLEGLSDTEFSSIESIFSFSFPPDLRSILQQGLPISPGFPNWRSSSPQQLQILLSLPILSLLRRVSQRKFWQLSWGPEPNDPKLALGVARKVLTNAPVLVPVYRHCYMSSSPNLAGNPVFYVDHDGEFRLLSFDISGFLREAKFVLEDSGLDNPVWAAKEARKIDVWSELAEARVETRPWWWWWDCVDPDSGRLSECLGDVYWTLKDGGWKEEEIREMMIAMDGGDHDMKNRTGSNLELENKDSESKIAGEDMTWHMRVLSLLLLRGGWTREDVVDSLGLNVGESKSWLGFYNDQPQNDIELL